MVIIRKAKYDHPCDRLERDAESFSFFSKMNDDVKQMGDRQTT